MSRHLPTAQHLIQNARRIVIKIGTDSIMANGDIDGNFVEGLVKSIVFLKQHNKEVVLVCSGAIGVGVRKMQDILQKPIDRKSLSLEEKQKAAMIGQPILMSAFQQEFSKYGFFCGQALLDKHDIRNKNMSLQPFQRACLNLDEDNLGLNSKFISILNENDPLVTAEITFGDNDILSGLITGVLQADLQILGSDVAGLHMKNPKKFPKLSQNPTLSHVWDIHSTFRLVADSPDTISNGGGTSKSISATLAANAGAHTILTRAKATPDFLDKIWNGERNCGTIYMPPPNGMAYSIPEQLRHLIQ